MSKYQTQIKELENKAKEGERLRMMLSEQASALKEEIERKERLSQRDNAPMEYLKNIVIAYMEAPTLQP